MYQGAKVNLASSPVTIHVVLCIHGSSRVSLATEGQTRPIASLRAGDLIRAADGSVVPVVGVVRCWARPPGRRRQDCVLFESGSLGDGLLSARLAVDPGHPLCTPDEWAGTRATLAFGIVKLKQMMNPPSSFRICSLPCDRMNSMNSSI